jgi:hypothetical protein
LIRIFPLAALYSGYDFMSGSKGKGFNGFAHFAVSDQCDFHGAVREV